MKFKVGDKVRIIQRKPGNTSGAAPGWDKPNGHVGIECVVHETNGVWYVLRDKIRGPLYYGLFDEDDVEEASSTTKPVKRVKYKPGDKVRITGLLSGDKQYGLSVGDIGEVHSTTFTPGGASVMFPSSTRTNKRHGMHGSQIELISPMPKNKFKAGDIVINKDGHIDTVVAVPGDPEYDRYNFMDAQEGMRLSKYSWERQSDWKLVKNGKSLSQTTYTNTTATTKSMITPAQMSSLMSIAWSPMTINGSALTKTKTTKKRGGKKNKMRKGFKVGDKVKFLGAPTGKKYFNYEFWAIGSIGIVTNLRNEEHGVEVSMNRYKKVPYPNTGTAKPIKGTLEECWVKASWLEKTTKKEKTEKLVIDKKSLSSLVLAEDVKDEIVAVLKQHNNKDTLFDKWGLGSTIEYGRGMTMMFYGSPGTGKTWGASCIAKALGTNLLTIGAAEIQSSEPGGANRSIQNAFKTAKEQNQVLFIDECDSLITNRADLGMILASEVNTLLTEIERFEGVCILATNRIDHMDEALERRLSLIVEFPFPDQAARKDIWKKLIPKKLPLHNDVKLDDLAKEKLSGGQIKNAILQSSRLALSSGARKVSKVHFTSAITRIKASKGLMGKASRYRQGGVDVGTEKTVARGKFTNFLEEEKHG